MQPNQVLGRTPVAASIAQALATLTPARRSEPRSRPKEADSGPRLFGDPLTDEVAPPLPQFIHLSISLGGGRFRPAAFGYLPQEQH